MELKLKKLQDQGEAANSLNRTFYGIETTLIKSVVMDLFPCLNRTFYGIETSAAAARALLPRMS